MVLLLAWKMAYPSHFHLARGNHESHELNIDYGFAGEVLTKYGKELYNMFQDMFDMLPLAHVVNNEVLVVHGGLPRANVGLAEIQALDRVAVSRAISGRHRVEEAGARGCDRAQEAVFTDLLWSDPSSLDGFTRSKRGPGLANFGPDVTEQFLRRNHLRLLIRSHEVKDEGFEWEHNRKCLTVFSAPDYCDVCKNLGAVVCLRAPDASGHLEAEIHQFEAVPRPVFYVRSNAFAPHSPLSRRYLSRSAMADLHELSMAAATVKM
eukprot:gnl/TRDRNA2_/TRDRNA2_177899_c2_seq1.p1 gnl/TRDRNA2_/TRDRNA2_177899_c2~~gnl/TRDRNA2_/TRDRNA2_177899_c2_seq1.p1  ORF type:complete len:264 (+),score=28.72 gnl/TRDRNA2_/TRDRNA2_177899_c2_seq1:516-1307(+)